MRNNPTWPSTVNINISLALPQPALDRIQDQLADLANQQKSILMTTTEAVAVIGKIETTLGTISAEQTEILTELRTALESAGNVAPEVAAGLDRLDTLATAIDNVIPAKVDPTQPPPVVTAPPAESATGNGQ